MGSAYQVLIKYSGVVCIRRRADKCCSSVKLSIRGRRDRGGPFLAFSSCCQRGSLTVDVLRFVRQGLSRQYSGYFLHHVLVRTSSNQGARFLAGNRHIPVRLLWVCGYDNYIGGAVCIHICLPCLQRGAVRFHYYSCTCIPALPSLEEVHTRFRGAHISEHRVSYPDRPSTQLRLHIAGGPLYIYIPV